MAVEHVEVLVEEPSMEAALRVLLPQILGNLSFAVHQHNSKKALLARLPGRLKGYAKWLPETCRVVVVLDCDQDDCAGLKARLESIDAHIATLQQQKASSTC